MSTDYFIINKAISKQEIIDNTDLTIRSQENGDWIVDKYNNGMYIAEGFFKTNENGEKVEINDGIIRELTRYGANNPRYILDTLSKKFGLMWIDDNSMEYFWRLEEGELTENQKNDKIREFVEQDMGELGYKIIDYPNSVVEVPIRNEEEYVIRSLTNPQPPPIGSEDQTYLDSLGDDEDLPF